jgi:protein-S-isoprenylcysteine O-methyltransferase Ste14
MNDFLSVALPTYFVLYFTTAFVLPTVLVAKRIGKNPMVLPNEDTSFGLVGRYFKFTLITIFLYAFIYPLVQNPNDLFLVITVLQKTYIMIAGVGLMLISFLWTVVAQKQMHNSWRIGIDQALKTELVTHGLFSISRNPIFFGMLLSLFGLFLVTPNAVTLVFLIVGFLLIQIQVRLEEEFLSNQHGEVYRKYKQDVRRYI